MRKNTAQNGGFIRGSHEVRHQILLGTDVQTQRYGVIGQGYAHGVRNFAGHVNVVGHDGHGTKLGSIDALQLFEIKQPCVRLYIKGGLWVLRPGPAGLFTKLFAVGCKKREFVAQDENDFNRQMVPSCAFRYAGLFLFAALSQIPVIRLQGNARPVRDAAG